MEVANEASSSHALGEQKYVVLNTSRPVEHLEMLWMDSRADRASMQKEVSLRVTDVTNLITLRKTPNLGKAGRVVLGNTTYACPVFTPPEH